MLKILARLILLYLKLIFTLVSSTRVKPLLLLAFVRLVFLSSNLSIDITSKIILRTQVQLSTKEYWPLFQAGV